MKNNKIVLITDDHFISSNFEMVHQIYTDLVIPTCKNHDTDLIVNLGDFTDKRIGLDALLQFQLWNQFIPSITEEDLKMLFLLGNHQTFFKDRNDVHTLEMFKHLPESVSSHFQVIDEPIETVLRDVGVTFIPWLVNHRDLPLEPKYDIVFGHFEAKGGYVTRQYQSKSGIDVNDLQNQTTFSGHYHIKQSLHKNFHYLGSPYQKNWNDFGERKGIHVLDLKTKELTFIENHISPRHIQVMIRNGMDGTEIIITDGLDLFKVSSLSDYKQNIISYVTGNHIKLIVDPQVKLTAKLKGVISFIQNQPILSYKSEMMKMVEEEQVDEEEAVKSSENSVEQVILEQLDEEHQPIFMEILQEVKGE